MTNILEIKNLSVKFNNNDKKLDVVKNLNLKLKSGEILGIVGESGSGKSVTALSILGLLPQDKATLSKDSSILFNNIELISNPDIKNIRGKDIGYIFQEPLSSLNPLHNIGKQISESILTHSNISDNLALRKALKLLKITGIKNPKDRLKSYPHQLSGGQRQRVMIAMAIANNPKILIADEPTTALDVTIQAQILDLLLKLRKDFGMSIIFISHDLSVINKIADNVCVMKNGSIIESNNTKDLFLAPQHSYTKELTSVYSDLFLQKIYSAKILLETKNINVTYPQNKNFFGKVTSTIQAADNISISVKEGHTLGIVGESGSGKSTLASVITKLIPFSGKVLFQGEDISNIDSKKMLKIRKNIQILFQDPFTSLNPRMNILEIIKEGLDIHFKDLSKEDKLLKIHNILKDVGLNKDILDKYPHEFSGGQRQRIAIARVLILEPKLLILDEPTSALDATIEQQILQLLNKIQKEKNISYIFISHNMRAIKSISHDIIVMKDGKIIEENTNKNIFELPQNEYTKNLIKASNL